MNVDVIILGIITFLGTIITVKTIFKIVSVIVYKFQKRRIKSII